jgi:hypothetical protein
LVKHFKERSQHIPLRNLNVAAFNPDFLLCWRNFQGVIGNENLRIAQVLLIQIFFVTLGSSELVHMRQAKRKLEFLQASSSALMSYSHQIELHM